MNAFFIVRLGVVLALVTLASACSSRSNGVAPDGGAPPVVGATVASLVLAPLGRTTTNARDSVAVFGHPFRRGDVPAGFSLAVRDVDHDVAAQMDGLSHYPDGSLRFAVISIPRTAASATGSESVDLRLADGPPHAPVPLEMSDARAAAPNTIVTLMVGAIRYRASLRAQLDAGTGTAWLAGPHVTEWHTSGPVLDDDGAPHPHLVARFGLRLLGSTHRARVEVTLENTWAYEPSPSSFAYDASVSLDGHVVDTIANVPHYRQARSRRVYWSGEPEEFHARLDLAYLIATGAVPSYEPGLEPSQSALTSLRSSYAAVVDTAMGVGLAVPYMPQTGGRWDIGPLPGWTAIYLLGGDPDARAAMLHTADAAGSWGIHYRDRTTDRPVSLDDHPRMTLLGNPGDTIDPDTGLSDAFPACAGDCDTPNHPDSAHQPSFAFVPYLLTGERYYLEELQFWANWNMLQANPAYRGREAGLLKWDQVRGQGWSMRTLADAAWITPDDHPLRAYFETRLANNLAWYTEHYVDLPATRLAHLDVPNAEVSSWMDDFFTWSIGHVVALGFEDARPLLEWKARFPVGRMTDATYCWTFAAPYRLIVRATDTGPLFESLGETYAPTLAFAGREEALDTACGSAAMASALGLAVGEMTGYAQSPEGFPSNMQPALAVAVDANIPNAAAAWERFAARPVRPDYRNAPQWAVVPRPTGSH